MAFAILRVTLRPTAGLDGTASVFRRPARVEVRVGTAFSLLRLRLEDRARRPVLPAMGSLETANDLRLAARVNTIARRGFKICTQTSNVSLPTGDPPGLTGICQGEERGVSVYGFRPRGLGCVPGRGSAMPACARIWNGRGRFRGRRR